jgi:hypothetical protein
MKLKDILEHEIGGDPTPKILKRLPTMKRVQPPFTKGFKKLLKVKRAKQIKDPVGGKVLKKDNTMKKGELGKRK